MFVRDVERLSVETKRPAAECSKILTALRDYEQARIELTRYPGLRVNIVARIGEFLAWIRVSSDILSESLEFREALFRYMVSEGQSLEDFYLEVRSRFGEEVRVSRSASVDGRVYLHKPRRLLEEGGEYSYRFAVVFLSKTPYNVSDLVVGESYGVDSQDYEWWNT